MTTWTRPQLYVSYETPTIEDGWQDEYASVLPRVGEGIIDSRGRRWRVVDIWHSDEKHGVVGAGVHVYLEPVPVGSDGDRPGRLFPQYFTG